MSVTIQMAVPTGCSMAFSMALKAVLSNRSKIEEIRGTSPGIPLNSPTDIHQKYLAL